MRLQFAVIILCFVASNPLKKFQVGNVGVKSFLPSLKETMAQISSSDGVNTLTTGYVPLCGAFCQTSHTAY